MSGAVATLLPAARPVLAVRRETADVTSLLLAPYPGGFAPGQFGMLWVPGAGEAAISISGDPGDARGALHTVRAVGDVTRALVRCRVGDAIGVRGPYGHGWPLAALRGRDVVLIAGGIGIAPLRSALLHLLAHAGDHGRLVLLVGARTPDDVPFARELEAWSRDPRLRVLVTVDRAPPGWGGYVGVVPALVRAAGVGAGAAALVCGPEAMMRVTVRALAEVGVDDDAIFLSLERHMQCGVGLCGHCQLGPLLVCRDGPVFPYAAVAGVLATREA